MTSMASAPGAGSHISPLITVFNALHMTGLVLLLAVTLTAWLAPTVKRSPAWYNVIISWIISSSSSLLLVGQQTGTIPSFGLCLFQAMLLYAAPAMNACVCLCFALEIFFGVFCAATQSRTPSGCKVLTVSLPYVTAFLVCIEVLTIGLIDEGLVIMIALIFGTQWDILHVWMFWRQHAKPPYPLPPVKPLAAPLPGEESESDIKLKPGGLSSV